MGMIGLGVLGGGGGSEDLFLKFHPNWLEDNVETLFGKSSHCAIPNQSTPLLETLQYERGELGNSTPLADPPPGHAR